MLHSKKLFVYLYIYVERLFSTALSIGMGSVDLRSPLILQIKLNKIVGETLRSLSQKMRRKNAPFERSGF